MWQHGALFATAGEQTENGQEYKKIGNLFDFAVDESPVLIYQSK
jgi:hypothetical protein